MMDIKEITQYSIWNNFINKDVGYSFLQTWEWGELQKKQGYNIIRLGIYKQPKLIAIVLVIKIQSKRGSFLFVPHGPVVGNDAQIKQVLDFLLEHLKQLAHKEKFSFIRIAPIIENTESNRDLFSSFGFKTAPIYMHAERTWVLDLGKSEEILLSEMRKTTRYLIKRADREGVIIEERSDEKALEEFLRIYKETANREHFVPFSLDYIKHECEEFSATNNALFLFGKVNQEYFASALILFTKHTAFYHQGASIHTKIPVTYRLQWEAIKEAKKRGCILYNFWGIQQDGRTPRNWGGLTMFKTGFGGRQVDYVPTQDYVISSKYYLTYFYEKYLAWKRGV
jgi:lipid II:glycine glycyltransferase (peptidoglycan interpeptide bridge formation enzyme)